MKKSEDRLEPFLEIHKLFPKFLHIDKFGFIILLVYDPKILRQLFNCNHLMQCPFKAFTPIEEELIFASCEFE